MQDFTDKPHPIQAAAPTMHNYMSNLVHEVVKLICISCLQLVSLPASIVSPAQGPPQKRQRGPREGTKKGEHNNQGNGPDWHSTNPSIRPNWKLPDGKTTRDFFHTQDEIGRANISRFPRVQHHITHKRAPICTTYQCRGTCAPTCRRAHILPSRMTRKIEDQCTAAFKAAFST